MSNTKKFIVDTETSNYYSISDVQIFNVLKKKSKDSQFHLAVVSNTENPAVQSLENVYGILRDVTWEGVNIIVHVDTFNSLQWGRFFEILPDYTKLIPLVNMTGPVIELFGLTLKEEFPEQEFTKNS